MTKPALFLLTLFFFSMISCKKESEQNESNFDTSTIDSSDVNKTLIDPDPTDTIPAGQYVENSSNLQTAEIVRSFLKKEYKEDLDRNIIDEFSRKFIIYEYDLNDDGNKEILVGLRGSYFCGTGGCSQLILDKNGNMIADFSVSGFPIYIDNQKTNGWKNLILYSGRKNRLIKFDGKQYPSNPSMVSVYKSTPGEELPRALDFEKEPYPWFKF